MNNERIKKIESRIRQIISRFLIEEIDEKEMLKYGIITVVKVKLSTDLSYLDLYVSCMTNKDKLTKFLATYGYNIHKVLNKNLKTWKIPKVRFRYDETGEIYQDICLKINSL